MHPDKYLSEAIMRKLVFLLSISLFSLSVLAQPLSDDLASEQMIDDARQAVEASKQDREELSENFREIANQKEDDEWFQEVENIIDHEETVE